MDECANEGVFMYDKMIESKGKTRHLQLKNLHHAYISFRSSVFNDVKYREDDLYYRSEYISYQVQ